MEKNLSAHVVFIDKRCPKCGSSNYVGGQNGGLCYACGYRWGHS